MRSSILACLLFHSCWLDTNALHQSVGEESQARHEQQHLNIDSRGHLSTVGKQSVLASGSQDNADHVSFEVAPVMRREGISSSPVGSEGELPAQPSIQQPIGMERALHKGNSSSKLLQVTPLSVGLRCNTPIFAPADPCPMECPYMAEDSQYICHFRCVAAEACGTLDPLARIPDDEEKICRRCNIAGCGTCAPGVADKCLECAVGYSMDGDGMCWSGFQWVMFIVKILVGVIFLVLVLWLVELGTRKKTNWRGLKHGVAFRWRTRIHMPADTPEEDGVIDTDNQDGRVQELYVYPLSTNLLRQPIAGPGTCLHYNFQVAVLIWAAVICYFYAMTACMVSIDMLVVGLSPAKTSQQLCSVVHWGHAAQMRDMWAKCYFIIFLYIFTFVGCMALGIYQYKEFHRLDDNTTMKDFAIFCTGLPKMKGSENAELKFKEFIQKETKQNVIGVSICWNYSENMEQVNLAVEADWKELETALAPPEPPEDPDNPTPRQPKLGCCRRNLRKIDTVFGFDPPPKPVATPSGETPSQEQSSAGFDAVLPSSSSDAPLLGEGASAPKTVSKEEITKILNDMETSDCAFIVFETEAGRDAAFEISKKRRDGLEFNGSKLSFEVKDCEPTSARFSGLGYGTGSKHRAQKIYKGCWIVAGALAAWVVCFYLPYAFYSASFSYAHGEEPPMFAKYFFSMLVVCGNQAMYFLADIISQRADFMFEDDREVAYNIIYVAACVLNVIADLIITIWLSYRQMVAMGVHTADDRLIENLGSFEEVFESYPVQKAFGEMLWLYCWPACFLLPFILEGVGTITLPYYVTRAIVLSHDEVQERDAELSLQYFLPMNLGRYGDINLNVILAVFVFFCPGGYTLPMFLALLLSHAYIYAYDHYRVIRCTPNFCFATTRVEWFGQLQLALPTGVLAAVAVFRCAQWWDYSWLTGAVLWILCIFAFLLHCLVHWACLMYVLPMFKPKDHAPSKMQYADCAKNFAINWFTGNPVHCLRSKYIFKHNPPAIAAIYGKEHLVKPNPQIGLHFDNPKFGSAYQMSGKLSDEEEAMKAEEQEAKEEAEEDAP